MISDNRMINVREFGMPKLVWTPLPKKLSTFVTLLWALSAHLSEIVNHKQ